MKGGSPKLELLVIKLVFSSEIRLKTELKGLRKYISLASLRFILVS